MHNQEVIAATEVLFNEVIPQCAASLLEVLTLSLSFPLLPFLLPFFLTLFLTQEFRQAQAESSQGDLSTFPKVSEIMHRAGVNVRYIGNVVQAVDELVGRKSKDPALVSAVIGALLAEAVARVVKNELNLLMREKAKELKLPLEVRKSIRKSVVFCGFFFFFFNLLNPCLVGSISPSCCGLFEQCLWERISS